jgi:phage protein U
MMAALGMFVFELGSLPYLELQRRTEARFAANPRIGARDAVQYVGPGDEEINLSGVAYAELMDGKASLDTLREMQAEGEAYPFVDGNGECFGSFVITNLDERHSTFWPNGVARAIEFGIVLKAVDDPQAEAAE